MGDRNPRRDTPITLHPASASPSAPRRSRSRTPPHSGCASFIERYGRDACLFVNKGEGRRLRLRGIYARVVQDGCVTVGDRMVKGGDRAGFSSLTTSPSRSLSAAGAERARVRLGLASPEDAEVRSDSPRRQVPPGLLVVTPFCAAVSARSFPDRLGITSLKGPGGYYIAFFLKKMDRVCGKKNGNHAINTLVCSLNVPLILEDRMVQKQFGSPEATGRKLDVIGEYLAMYQTALAGKFETIYIDAFAGTGEIPVGESEGSLLDEDEEAKSVIAGSAVRAVGVSPPFSRYVFIDKRRICIDALRRKFDNHPNTPRIEYRVGDANDHVQALCHTLGWSGRRGVVLLDPFGSQVNWATVEAIAATRSLDLWYLFPAGLGVFRQISSNGRVDPTHEPSLTRMFGTDEWRTTFLRPSRQGNLFGGPQAQEKVVTAKSAAEYMVERMKGVFWGGVLDVMMPLGKHAYPSYYLLFAWGNPSPKARELAARLSKAAIDATDRKHGRPV